MPVMNVKIQFKVEYNEIENSDGTLLLMANKYPVSVRGVPNAWLWEEFETKIKEYIFSRGIQFT